MLKKRVAIIGTTGLPAKYGGFETLANHLVDRLNKRFELTVYCSNKYFAKKHLRPAEFNGAKLVYIPLNANGYQSIIYDTISIFHALRKSDVLLLLGVSGAMAIPFVKLISKKPVIVNIDGQEWRRPKWNWLAKKYLTLCERIAVRFADTVIADNKYIRESVENNHKRFDSVLIEYGADHVSKINPTPGALMQYEFLSKPYAFNVCRIEPENNIHLVLEAFSNQPQHTLVMVGLWNHGNYGMELKSRYSNYPNIHLLDPIYNQEELNMLRSNASVYIHGHTAGGTNPSLVEAMGLGLPVIAFDINYNRETTGNHALYFRNATDLMRALNQLNEYARKEMSVQLLNMAREKYTWKRITDLYALAFTNKNVLLIDDLTSFAAGKKVEKIIIREAQNQQVI